MLTFWFLFVFLLRVPGSLPSSDRSSFGIHTDWIFFWILAVRCEGYLFSSALSCGRASCILLAVR